MEYKYLNKVRTEELVDEIKRRLGVRLIVTDVMPESAEDGAMRLYSGETDVTFAQSHIYRYDATEAIWEDVTSDNDKYPIAWDVELTQAEYDALPDDKNTDDKNYYITDNEEETIVYTWTIDPDETDPYDRVIYADDAVGMTPASMGNTSFSYGSWEDTFFMPRPCMLKSDGTVDYYLDPNDYSKKENGAPSDIADPNYDGNAMIEWGLIWFSYDPDAKKFSCSNQQVDNSYDCPCNKDVNGEIIPHFYTAIYNGTGIDTMRSLSGIALTSENGNGGTGGQDEIDRAVANNTTSDIEWYTGVWCDRMLINALLILISHSTDSQGKFGRGMDNNKDSTTAQALKESYITGTMNTRGLFYGDINDGYAPVKVFGMENWWGCVWNRIAGLRGVTNGYKYKLTQPYEISGLDYDTLEVTKPSSGDISECTFGEFGLLPIATEGSSSTYYADTFHNGTGYALVGDCSGSGYNCGAFALGLHGAFFDSSWSVSASLSCKPLKSRF